MAAGFFVHLRKNWAYRFAKYLYGETLKRNIQTRLISCQREKCPSSTMAQIIDKDVIILWHFQKVPFSFLLEKGSSPDPKSCKQLSFGLQEQSAPIFLFLLRSNISTKKQLHLNVSHTRPYLLSFPCRLIIEIISCLFIDYPVTWLTQKWILELRQHFPIFPYSMLQE